MSAAHIDTALGAYLLWSVVSAPAAMMVPATGAFLIAAAGIGLAISVPLAGALVEAPWLLVAFFAIAAAASTYFLTDAQLTNGWRMVQIFVLSSFWVIVFDPAGFGWSVAYAFAAALAGFLFIMVFDNVLWPDPADGRLARSLGAGIDALRVRLRAVGDSYLDPAGGAALPRSTLEGPMSAQLALLSRAERENLDPLRHARLLAAVGAYERMRLEVERLLAVAREPVPRRLRNILRPQMQAILEAIQEALAIELRLLADGLEQTEDAMADAAGPIYSMLEAYNRRVAELHPQFIAQAPSEELSNLSAFVLGLQRLGRLFIHTPIPIGATARRRLHVRPVVADPERARYCVKLAAAVAIAFVIGVTTHRGDLTTILWTVMITGLPTYGASMRKMILRFAGAALGGALALVAIIAVSPNFETVLSYIAAFFIALLPCAYLGLSGGRLSYPGKQAGVTFCLLFVGLSPSLREYEALWRLWGVLLGEIVVAIVFILLWPEYAGESMVPRLQTMLEMIISMMPRDGAVADEQEIERVEIRCSRTLSELLAIADDARMEGGRSGIDPDAAIHALGTLRRIAHRVGSIAGSRNSQYMSLLDPQLQSARGAADTALRSHFEACLNYVRHRFHDAGPVMAWNESTFRTAIDEIHRRIAADNFGAISAWPLTARRSLLADIEAYRRLGVLAGELSEQLAEVALPRRSPLKQPHARTAPA